MFARSTEARGPLWAGGVHGAWLVRKIAQSISRRVSDAQLGALYRACAVFCFPSLAEGFGLPVAEAMALGAPVVTSGRGSLPEVAGDAAVYVDPESVGAIARGLERVLADPAMQADMSRRGRARAAAFTWDGFASRVLAALAGAAARARA